MIANGVGIIDPDYSGPTDEVMIQVLKSASAYRLPTPGLSGRRPRVLLTGGLLVRLQPEEPIPHFRSVLAPRALFSHAATRFARRERGRVQPEEPPLNDIDIALRRVVVEKRMCSCSHLAGRDVRRDDRGLRHGWRANSCSQPDHRRGEQARRAVPRCSDPNTRRVLIRTSARRALRQPERAQSDSPGRRAAVRPPASV